MAGLSALLTSWTLVYLGDLLRDPAGREHLQLVLIRGTALERAARVEERGRRVRVNWWATPRARRMMGLLLGQPGLVLVVAVIAQGSGAPRAPIAAAAGLALSLLGVVDQQMMRTRGLYARSDMGAPMLLAVLAAKSGVAAVAVWILLDAWHRASNWWLGAAAEFVLALVVASVAHRPVVWAERRARRRTRADFGSESGRGNLLYLRAFGDDGVRQRTPIQTGGLPRSLLPFPRVRFEEALAALLADNGELVTVGRPGERLPELGATRTYFPHDGWQDAVRETAHRCQAVFLVAGLTSSLGWEIDQLRAWGLLSKTMILLPLTRTASGALAGCSWSRSCSTWIRSPTTSGSTRCGSASASTPTASRCTTCPSVGTGPSTPEQ